MKWSALNKKKYLGLTLSLLGLAIFLFSLSHTKCFHDSPAFKPIKIYEFIVDVKADDIRFVWKDAKGKRFANAAHWKKQLKKQGKQLLFAMNGGMYQPDGSPIGLFIEQGVTHKKIDLSENKSGNFYMQPNGVLYITNSKTAGICLSAEFCNLQNVYYATQSGPMLVINGAINSHFRADSTNKHIRNGVGLLADGRLLFAMSKSTINFHDFAHFFKNRGCQNALYLDGFVSRMYAPESGIEQSNGDFGVMIGVIK